MNYQKVYVQLCLKYKALNLSKDSLRPGAFEEHHILPKACNGTNDISNLVLLPVKAHFVAHHLLSKIYKNTKFEHVMNAAYCCMCFMTNVRNKSISYRISAKQYAYARQLSGEATHARKGYKLPPEFGNKMSQILTGRKLTPEHKKNISKGMKGMKHPGVSEKLKGRKRDKSISEKIANKLRGRKNPTAGAKISAKLKGKKHSIERNIAQSKRQKGKKLTWIDYQSMRNKPLSESIKQKIREAWKIRKSKPDYISPNKGIKKPPRSKQHIENQRKAFKGRIWVTNGIVNRYVFPNNIPEGFFHGRIIKGKLKIFN